MFRVVRGINILSPFILSIIFQTSLFKLFRTLAISVTLLFSGLSRPRIGDRHIKKDLPDTDCKSYGNKTFSMCQNICYPYCTVSKRIVICFYLLLYYTI